MKSKMMALACALGLAGLLATPLLAAPPSDTGDTYVVVIRGVT